MAHSRDVDVWIWDVNDLRTMHVEMVQTRVRVNARRFWQPSVDVYESEREFLVKAELAGVRTEDVTLAFLPDENVLRIRGVRQDHDGATGQIGIHQLEILHGEFERDVRLPRGEINPDRIRAELSDGILRVRLAKRIPHV